MKKHKNKFLATFREMSSVFTGFSQADIEGTGLNEIYFDTIHEQLGNKSFVALLGLFASIEAETSNPTALKQQLRHQIFANPEYGPLARNIIQLWYTGTWNSMSAAWVSTYGPIHSNRTFIISGQAYLNGLVWPAVGAHPMGGKQEGFATWSFPPPQAKL